MRIIKCSLLLLVLTILSASESYGQRLLSVKGYFCGQTEPSYVNVHLKVGNTVKVFSTSPDGGFEQRGFSGAIFELPIGTELIIKYKRTDGMNWIWEVRATGKRNRSVRRCASD